MGKWQLYDEIAKLIEKPPATVFSYLRYHGGIQPSVRTRAPLSLSLEEREEISRGLVAGISMRAIATSLNRSASTISREVKKNGGMIFPRFNGHRRLELV